MLETHSPTFPSAHKSLFSKALPTKEATAPNIPALTAVGGIKE